MRRWFRNLIARLTRAPRSPAPGHRAPATDKERRIFDEFGRTGRRAYEVGVECFERRGEMGEFDDHKARMPIRWGNGHHQAQRLSLRAQQIFLKALPEEHRDLLVDDWKKFLKQEF